MRSAAVLGDPDLDGQAARRRPAARLTALELGKAGRRRASARSRRRRSPAGGAGARRAGTPGRAARSRRSGACRRAPPAARPRPPRRPARRGSAAPGGRPPGRPRRRPGRRRGCRRGAARRPRSPAPATLLRAMFSIWRERSRPTRALGPVAQQGEHAPGAGAEIDQAPERPLAGRLEDRRLDRGLGDVERADLVPAARRSRRNRRPPGLARSAATPSSRSASRSSVASRSARSASSWSIERRAPGPAPARR